MGRRLYRLGHRLVLQPWFRLRRGMTLGVRAVVRDSRSRVLLVRHSYAPGWALPGGGVERGETVGEAVRKELREEAGIEVTSAPRLFAIYNNDGLFAGDHVAVFLVDDYVSHPRPASLEIIAAEFFSSQELPQDTSPGTVARIREVIDGLDPAERW